MRGSDNPVDPGEGPGGEPRRFGGRNVETDFHGETRTNATLAITTDPEAKLYRKGAGMEARLVFLGHALIATLCIAAYSFGGLEAAAAA